MGVRSDAARTLDKMMGIAGISALQDHFDPPEHLPGTPCVFDLAPLYFNFDSKMSFDSCNRIDGYSFSHMISSLFAEKDLS